MAVNLSFANNLKRLTSASGFKSQKDLAEKAGMEPAQVSRYFKGQVPDMPQLKRLAKALGVEAEELISDGDEQKSDETLRKEAIRLLLDADRDTLEIVLDALRRYASTISDESKASAR